VRDERGDGGKERVKEKRSKGRAECSGGRIIQIDREK
jgi:hypothetical protein